MRSFDRTSGNEEPWGALKARVKEFSRVLETMQELPSRFGLRVPAEAHDPALLRDALERLHREHRELGVAREVLQAELDELESTRSALERERRRYRDLFDFTEEPYLRTDRRGVIQEVNPAAGRLLGVEPTALAGRGFESLVVGADRVRVAAALDRVGAGGALEVVLGGVVGSRPGVRVTLRATPVENGVLWSARPVGVSPESAGDEAADPGAESRVSWEQLDAANRSKDRVLAILGHELRTPINVILGWAALVRNGRLDSDARARAMSIIERTALTEAALLDRLLDASRLTAHKLMVRPDRLDLGEVVRRAVEAMGPLASQREITVTCTVEPGLFVKGDPERLSQVLFNLLTNALKYSPTGSQVRVIADRREGALGPEVRLSVRDQGCGIAAENLQVIFECFRQLDERQKCLSGLGLGLFIVREIVTLHGGVVRAESAGPGAGAEFIVTLPLDATGP